MYAANQAELARQAAERQRLHASLALNIIPFDIFEQRLTDSVYTFESKRYFKYLETNLMLAMDGSRQVYEIKYESGVSFPYFMSPVGKLYIWQSQKELSKSREEETPTSSSQDEERISESTYQAALTLLKVKHETSLPDVKTVFLTSRRDAERRHDSEGMRESSEALKIITSYRTQVPKSPSLPRQPTQQRSYSPPAPPSPPPRPRSPDLPDWMSFEPIEKINRIFQTGGNSDLFQRAEGYINQLDERSIKFNELKDQFKDSKACLELFQKKLIEYKSGNWNAFMGSLTSLLLIDLKFNNNKYQPKFSLSILFDYFRFVTLADYRTNRLSRSTNLQNYFLFEDLILSVINQRRLEFSRQEFSWPLSVRVLADCFNCLFKEHSALMQVDLESIFKGDSNIPKGLKRMRDFYNATIFLTNYSASSQLHYFSPSDRLEIFKRMPPFINSCLQAFNNIIQEENKGIRGALINKFNKRDPWVQKLYTAICECNLKITKPSLKDLLEATDNLYDRAFNWVNSGLDDSGFYHKEIAKMS